MSSEGIARKKRIRGGHKSSATRMLTQIDTLLTEDPPDLARLSQLKLSIQEKLETIKLLDGELLDQRRATWGATFVYMIICSY